MKWWLNRGHSTEIYFNHSFYLAQPHGPHKQIQIKHTEQTDTQNVIITQIECNNCILSARLIALQKLYCCDFHIWVAIVINDSFKWHICLCKHDIKTPFPTSILCDVVHNMLLSCLLQCLDKLVTLVLWCQKVKYSFTSSVWWYCLIADIIILSTSQHLQAQQLIQQTNVWLYEVGQFGLQSLDGWQHFLTANIFTTGWVTAGYFLSFYHQLRLWKIGLECAL